MWFWVAALTTNKEKENRVCTVHWGRRWGLGGKKNPLEEAGASGFSSNPEGSNNMVGVALLRYWQEIAAWERKSRELGEGKATSSDVA